MAGGDFVAEGLGQIVTWMELFFLLCCGHALADYPLQADFLAKGKNRHTPVIPGQLFWPHCLTAHALIHAGTVWVITGSMACALIEAAAHWWIDFAKCEGWTNIHVDQLLHYACKLCYAVVLVNWW